MSLLIPKKKEHMFYNCLHFCQKKATYKLCNSLYVANLRVMLSAYACVIGMDCSPYDNMPLVVQKSQIYNNLAITYYFGSEKLKVIPNARLGNDKTISMLDALPRECLIGIGTNGFMRKKHNRIIFRK